MSSQTKLVCPDCGIEMEIGNIAALSQDPNVQAPLYWMGEKLEIIGAYACNYCGFIRLVKKPA